MKKILTLLIILMTFCAPSFSFDFNSESKQIRILLNKHNKAMDKHDIEKIKTFYDKDYKSADGFNLQDLHKMLSSTYSSYKNIKYKTKINNITLFDDYAIAQVSDKTSAIIYPETKKKKNAKTGYLTGKSVYTVYLRKNEDGWKIFYDDILMEETSLKYGIANKINMNLSAPAFANTGEEYDVALKMNKPEDIIALGSISNEEIVFPPVDYTEKFRKISQQGELERIVRANKKNIDEYAIASVGFTKLSLNEEQTKAKIEVLGMAYLMKRINIQNKKGINEKQL